MAPALQITNCLTHLEERQLRGHKAMARVIRVTIFMAHSGIFLRAPLLEGSIQRLSTISKPCRSRYTLRLS